jgi:hypothetical protein
MRNNSHQTALIVTPPKDGRLQFSITRPLILSWRERMLKRIATPVTTALETLESGCTPVFQMIV